jgi:hypothetical protein
VTGVDENREKEKSLWIGEYRRCGYLPLPSDPALKKPLVKYRSLWDRTAEIDFGRFPGSNVQVVCGCLPRVTAILEQAFGGPDAVIPEVYSQENPYLSPELKAHLKSLWNPSPESKP